MTWLSDLWALVSRQPVDEDDDFRDLEDSGSTYPLPSDFYIPDPEK